jgi:predicted dehydrogenase
MPWAGSLLGPQRSSKMTQREVRVGLIGSKFMGVAHSNAFRNAGIWFDLPVKIAMKAVAGRDVRALAAFASKFGWESYETDWRRLVARTDIDLVSVATPGNLHKEMVLEAVRHGKHVICEKPLANSLSDAKEMLQAAECAGVSNCCSFSYRFTPSQALAKQFVDEGKIGRIYHVHARYAQDWIVDPSFPLIWRLDKSVAGTGVLGDISAHSIDATRFITGLEFREVVGNLSTLIKKRPLNANDPQSEVGEVTVDDVAQFLCNFSTGATGCFESTRLATGRKSHNCIEVNGDRGSLYWDFEQQNYLYYYNRQESLQEQGFRKINVTDYAHPYGGGPWPAGHGIGYGDTFVIEIASFIRAIAENKSFQPDFTDGVECQRVLEAVEKSAAERCWVSIP